MHKRSMLWAGAGVLLLAGPGAAAEVGKLAGAFPRAGESAPHQVSTRYVLEGVDLGKGVSLPLTGGSTHLAVLSHDREVSAVYFVDGRGQSLVPGRGGLGEANRFMEPDLASYDLPAYGLGLRLEGMEVGTYTLRGDDGSGPVAVVVNEEGSAVEMRVTATPLAARAGEPVTIEAVLRDGATPIRGAKVNVRLMEWERPRAAVALREITPGRYQGTVTARPTAGLMPLSIRVEARGELAGGASFARTALTAAMVSAGVADVDVTAIGATHPAAFRAGAADEALSIPVAGRAGDYRLEAIFGADSDEGAVSLAYSREDFHLDVARREISLPVPAEAAGADRMTLRLLNRETLGVEREVEVPIAVDGDVAPRPPAARAALPASKAESRARFDESPPRQR